MINLEQKIRTLANMSACVWVVIDNVLTEVNLENIHYQRKGDETYDIIVTVYTADDDCIEAGLDRLYSSPEDYEKGIPVKTIEVTLREVCYKIFRSRKREPSNPEYWMWVDGHAEKRILSLEGFFYNCVLGYYVAPEVPEGNIYDTRDECFAFNGYDVRDIDGDKKKRTGIESLLLLDEHQKALMSELEDVLRKIHDADILLTVDDNDKCRAFNIRNIDDYELDYDNPDDEVYTATYSNHPLFEQRFGIPYYSCDYKLFVKKD